MAFDSGAAEDPDRRPDPGLYGGAPVVTTRRLTRSRLLAYGVLSRILGGLIRLVWATCRVRPIVGAEHGEAILASGRPCVPCLWHEHLCFGLWYLRTLRQRGLEPTLLISPSVDGELATMTARSFGARVVRGSATRTGAKAFRGLLEALVEEGASPMTTPDGPAGPPHRFKKGAVMLSSKGRVPLLFLACASRWTIRLPTWDRLQLPVPFSRVAIAVGEPHQVPADLSREALEAELDRAARALDGLRERAREAVGLPPVEA